MKQTRRELIHSVCGGFSLGWMSITALQSKSRNKSRSLDEKEQMGLELLGKKRPTLIGKGYSLRTDASGAYDQMVYAASQDGITLVACSSYRSFNHQKSIWNQKFQTLSQKGLPPQSVIEQIIEYSSIPGTSRHHWGTDVDIIDGSKAKPDDPLRTELFQKEGIYSTLYQWLKEHASTYGFYEAYPQDPNRTGFAYEPWHWSFSPLSIPFLKQYLELDLFSILKSRDIKGYNDLTQEFLERYIHQWVLGIQSSLIPPKTDSPSPSESEKPQKK